MNPLYYGDNLKILREHIKDAIDANSTKLAAWTFASHVERHTPVPRDAKQKKPPAPESLNEAMNIDLPLKNDHTGIDNEMPGDLDGTGM